MTICYKFYISSGLIYNFMNPVNFSNILQNKINARGYAAIVSNMKIFIFYDPSSTFAYCCIMSHHLYHIFTSHFFNRFTNCVNNISCNFCPASCINWLQNKSPFGQTHKMFSSDMLSTLVQPSHVMVHPISFQLSFTTSNFLIKSFFTSFNNVVLNLS